MKRLAAAVIVSASLFLSGGGNALAKPVEHVPKDPKLQEIYKSFKEFRSDVALARLSPLINRRAKAGLKTERDRLIMARLLSLAGYAFYMDENLLAGTNMFTLARKLAPGDAVITCYLASAMREVPDFEAEGMYNAELEALPDEKKTSLVYFTLARHYKRLGDFESTLKYLKKAEELDVEKRDAALQLFYARTLIFMGLGKPAVERFELAAERTENPYMREILLANAALVNLDDAAQEKHLIAAGKIYPFDPIWRVKLSEVYLGRGKEVDALKLLQEALDCKRFSGSAHIKVARYYWLKKKYDLALQAVNRFEDLSRVTAETLLVKADIESSRNNNEQAEKVYQMAVHLDPRYPGAYENLSKFYSCKVKKIEEAVHVSEDFVTAMPMYWPAHFLHASALMYAHDLNAANVEARKTLVLLLDNAKVSELNLYAQNQAAHAYAIEGTCHYAHNKIVEATDSAKWFNKMKFNPDLPEYLKIMMLRPGRLNYNGLGDKDPMIHVALADMLLETNFLSDSVVEYKKAIALLPNDQQLRSYQMHVLSKKGDWAAAAQENLALSQQIVNSIPKSIEEWQRGKEPQDKPGAR